MLFFIDPRFFQSLKGNGGNQTAPSVDDAWKPPLARGSFLQSLGSKDQGDQEVQSESKVKVKEVNFTVESVAQFKNDHVEHTAHRVPPPTSEIGRRPNYDSRKRKLFAAQPLERRKCLDFRRGCMGFDCLFKIIVFLWDWQVFSTRFS